MTGGPQNRRKLETARRRFRCLAASLICDNGCIVGCAATQPIIERAKNVAKAARTLREHRHFIVVVAILIVVMTFPTIKYVFNTDVFWLPTGRHTDAWMKFWDAWYGKRILAGEAHFYYTDLLFYPRGVSLVYHNFSIPHMLVFGGLQALMPASNAYNLTFLLIVAAVTCSAYVYMLYLFKDKWVALLGALIIGLSPHVVGYPEHPEYRFIATVPLALYFFHRGLDERRYKLVFYAALTTGLTAYASMHVLVCLVIMLGMLSLYFLGSRWREAVFWAAVFSFAATVAIIGSARIVPMIDDAQALEDAVGGQKEWNNDLLEYFINARHPLTKRLFPEETFAWGFGVNARFSSYLGYSVLALIAIGFAHKSYRRRMMPWILMAIPFLLLRLGSVLTIGGVSYPQILLPKHYLDDLVPAVTEAFRVVSAFYLGALIPLASLACFGASALLQRASQSRRPLIVLIAVGVVCFEYYQPVRPGVINEKELAFLNWLEDERVDVRLVNLPMNIWSHKSLYSFHQTQKGYPHADGAIARTLSDTLVYIKQNHLLNEWKGGRAIYCTRQARDEYLAALNQLAADGFTHVVLHKHRGLDHELADSFVGIEASYDDDYAAVYRLRDFRKSCDIEYMTEYFSAFPLVRAYLTPSLIHERNGLVVSFHPSQPAPEAFISYFSDISSDEKNMVHLSYNNLDDLVVQGMRFLGAALEENVYVNNGFWFVHNPQKTDLSQAKALQSEITKRFRVCNRFLDRADATVDLYVKRDIPCEALGEKSKYEVRYDNGVRLHNVSYNIAENHVTFYLVWTIGPERDYSFSIQFFDELGQKAHQYDNAVFRDVATVDGVDISSLSEGAYDIKLILYDPESGVRENGTVIESDQRFERFLDIGTIEIEPGV